MQDFLSTFKKLKSDTSIQSFEEFMLERCYNSLKHSLQNIGYYPTQHHPIQHKLLFENCVQQQLLRSFAKLVSKVLLPKAYALLAERVKELQQKSDAEIKTCADILSELCLGDIQKEKTCHGIIKISVKE